MTRIIIDHVCVSLLGLSWVKYYWQWYERKATEAQSITYVKTNLKIIKVTESVFIPLSSSSPCSCWGSPPSPSPWCLTSGSWSDQAHHQQQPGTQQIWINIYLFKGYFMLLRLPSKQIFYLVVLVDEWNREESTPSEDDQCHHIEPKIFQ